MSRQKSVKIPKQVPGVTQMTASPGPTIQCDGKLWRLGFNHQDAKARLEELFRAHVIRDALTTKRLLGGKDGEEHYQQVSRMISKGFYLTFADGWQELIGSPVGGKLFLMSLLQEHHPDITSHEVDYLLITEPEQSKAAVEAISPDFFSAVARQLGVKATDATEIAKQITLAIAQSNQQPIRTPDTGSTS